MIMKKEQTYKLTNREYDILRILWTSEDPLTASGIVERGNDLPVNTVQAMLKRLLKRELIHVDQIVYSGTVLSRAYRPSLSQEDFETRRYVDNMSRIQGEDFSCSQFVAAFLGQEKDHQKVWKEIGELESLLARKKQEIKEKGR